MARPSKFKTKKFPAIPVKILLVEDEPILVGLYQTMLRNQRYSVATATEEEEGLRKLTSEHPAIVLLDLMIPSKIVRAADYNFHEPVGFEILKAIKTNPRMKTMKVIVLTNLDADEHRQRAQKLGADDYVVKAQVLPRDLAEKIERLLARRTL